MSAGQERGELAEQIAKVAEVLRLELANPGADPVHSLASARSLRGLTDDAMQALVVAARERGVPWQRIGDALGITRQAAFQRFGAPIDPRTGVAMNRTVLPDAAERGLELLAHVAAHRWSDACAGFSPSVAAQLGPDSLADAYASVVALAGALESTGVPEVTAMAGVSVVDVPLHHEAADLVGRVSFGPAGDVVGLWFLPAAVAGQA
jgi:hypothetical protein